MMTNDCLFDPFAVMEIDPGLIFHEELVLVSQKPLGYNRHSQVKGTDSMFTISSIGDNPIEYIFESCDGRYRLKKTITVAGIKHEIPVVGVFLLGQQGIYEMTALADAIDAMRGAMENTDEGFDGEYGKVMVLNKMGVRRLVWMENRREVDLTRLWHPGKSTDALLRCISKKLRKEAEKMAEILESTRLMQQIA